MQRISGKYLKYLRRQKGYSLREFADKIYSSKSSVQRWEKSYLPENDDILNKISEVFSVPVEEMRRISQETYGGGKEDYTAEQLAEIKFGTKGLVIGLCALLGLPLIAFIIMLAIAVF